MKPWPGRQNGGNHCDRTEYRKKKFFFFFFFNEDLLIDLWDKIKWISIHIIGVPEGEETEKDPPKNIWRENRWKLPSCRKGNSQSSPGSVESQEGYSQGGTHQDP